MRDQAFRQVATLRATHKDIILIDMALSAVSTLIQSMGMLSHAFQAEVLWDNFLVIVSHRDHFTLQHLSMIHLLLWATVFFFSSVEVVPHGSTSIFLVNKGAAHQLIDHALFWRLLKLLNSLASFCILAEYCSLTPL